MAALSPASPVNLLSNQFFNRLPDDAITSIFEYIAGDNRFFSGRGNDRVIVATAGVCRDWRDNATLMAEREKVVVAAIRTTKYEYPEEMIQLFQKGNYPIWRLPVLNLDPNRPIGSYIESIYSRDMNQAVMKFQDKFGRPGVALKVQISSSLFYQYNRYINLSNLRYAFAKRNLPKFIKSLKELKITFKNRKRSGQIVLAIFKRYSDPNSSTWTCHWEHGTDIPQRLYSYRHHEISRRTSLGMELPRVNPCSECDLEPKNRIKPEFVRDLLTNQDKDFKLLIKKLDVEPKNQLSANFRKKSLSRDILVTALAVLAITCFVSYCLASEQR